MHRILSAAETDTAELAAQHLEEAALDEMLNTEGFAQFLAKHPEGSIKHEAGNEDLKKAFEVFKVKEEVKSDLKEMYSGEIGKEMGVKIGPEDLSSIDDHLETQAIEDPDAVLEFREKIEEFKRLPKEIGALEAEAGKLSGAEGWKEQLEGLKAKDENIQTVKDNLFSFGGALSMLADMPRAMDAYKAAKALKGEGMPLHIGDLNVNQMETRDRIKHIQDALEGRGTEGLKGDIEKQHADLRADIMKGVGASAKVAALVRKKAIESLNGLTKGEDIDGAQQQFEKLKGVQESSGAGGIDLGIDAWMAQEEIDQMVKKASLKKMTESIQALKLGKNSLSEMEKALGFFLEKDKMGSKEGEAARKLIGNALTEAQKQLGDSIEAKAKRILIARIRAKFKL
jgi:hypothetical protein